MKALKFKTFAIMFLSLSLFCSCASKEANLRAQAEKGNLKEVKELVSEGAAVDNKGYADATPLMLASGAGRLHVVQYLVENGAFVQSKDIYGYTSLAYAMEKFHFGVSDYLLQKGTDINNRSNEGKSMLMRASEQGNEKAVTFLIQNGADLNLKDNNGFTALYYAVEKDFIGTVKLLVEKGAQIKVKTNTGLTPLMSAGYHVSSKVFPFLFETDKDVNQESDLGFTALSFAAMGASNLSKDFDPSILTKIKNAGADLSIKDKKGRSIMELLQIEGQYLIDRQLKKIRADHLEKNPAQGFYGIVSVLVDTTISKPISNYQLKKRIDEIKKVLYGSE